MWTIVRIDADNSIEPIPTHWLNKDKTKCAWPNNGSIVNKLRHFRSKPNELDFSYFNCQVLTNNIDSLTDATKKAKLAMYISDLSDADEKKIKTNHISERKRKVINLLKNSSELPGFKKVNTLKAALVDAIDIDKNYVIPAISFKEDKLNYDSENVELTFNAASSKISQHSFQKLIVKRLISLEVEISNLLNTQQEIIKIVKDIQGRITTQTDDPLAHDLNYFVSSWPISSKDDLNYMENKIKHDSNFQKQVLSELEKIKEKSLPDMMKKILKRVFKDNILLEFTYYGLRKKDNFSLLAINKLIIETVSKSKFKHCSNKDIITAISKWLNGAKRRITKKKN